MHFMFLHRFPKSTFGGGCSIPYTTFHQLYWGWSDMQQTADNQWVQFDEFDCAQIPIKLPLQPKSHRQTGRIFANGPRDTMWASEHWSFWLQKSMLFPFPCNEAAQLRFHLDWCWWAGIGLVEMWAGKTWRCGTRFLHRKLRHRKIPMRHNKEWNWVVQKYPDYVQFQKGHFTRRQGQEIFTPAGSLCSWL